MGTYTAGDQINRALRLLGVLASGETPSADDSNDALMALNQMIDSWNTERLSVYDTLEQVATWPAGQATQTLGPSGSLVVTGGAVRPVLVDDSTYFKDPGTGISFPIKLINQAQYNGIALKTIQATYPNVMWVNMTEPNISLSIYPVPTTNLEFHFISAQELAQPATLTTTFVLPPGYLRAFTYNLAVEIAPEFGVEPSPSVLRVASTSKRNIKRLNNLEDAMAMPYELLVTNPRYNVYTDNA